jgi:hypothetical protein
MWRFAVLEEEAKKKRKAPEQLLSGMTFAIAGRIRFQIRGCLVVVLL